MNAIAKICREMGSAILKEQNPVLYGEIQRMVKQGYPASEIETMVRQMFGSRYQTSVLGALIVNTAHHLQAEGMGEGGTVDEP